MEPTPIEFKSKPLTKRQKTFLKALKNSLGVISTVSETTGVGRNTHYTWMKENPVYKQEVEEIQETALDFGESQLYKLMQGIEVREIRRKYDPDHTPEGDQARRILEETTVSTAVPCKTSVIFFLKTKGKKRGFIERHEITGADGDPLISPAMAPIIVRMETTKKDGE